MAMYRSRRQFILVRLDHLVAKARKAGLSLSLHEAIDAMAVDAMRTARRTVGLCEATRCEIGMRRQIPGGFIVDFPHTRKEREKTANVQLTRTRKACSSPRCTLPSRASM